MPASGTRSPIRFRAFARSDAARDVFWAWLAATTIGGVPSTFYAVVTRADPLEATRAAGAMLISAQSSTPALVAAATLVHCAVSLFWVVILVSLLPRRHVLAWWLAAAGLVALLDLRAIAPLFFPEVARLDFWPQFADHLMWGGAAGVALRRRWKKRATAGCPAR